MTIFALEDLLSAILDKLLEASDLDGHQDLGFRLWSGDMEGDTVKVGNGLVNGGGWCPVEMRCQCF